MNRFWFFLTILGLHLLSSSASASPVFRFHLLYEPASLKPWEQKTSSAGYFLSQLTGTLLKFQDHRLQGDLAEKCDFLSPTHIQCRLRKNLKWSDGSPLTAADFVRSFQSLVDPKNHAFRADLMFPVKNARQIFAKKKPPTDLKASAPKPLILDIQLEKPDAEFLYTLASPLLGPVPESPLLSVEELKKDAGRWKSSGPYVMKSWEGLRKISLRGNPFYWKKSNRPELEILLVNEDSVALNLYEKGELTFLRRLPTLYIPKYKDRPDFFEVEQIRFDYLGFSQQWSSVPDLRLSLAQALRYTDLQKLFHSKGLPGCPGIPQALHTEKICHSFRPEQARKLWGSLAKKPAKLEMIYSRQGGDDHRRSMEWIQSEWKSQLGAHVELSGLENKIFLEKLRTTPPDLFRKGLAPDRPTCLAALETFETGSSENYIHYSNREFDNILEAMRTTRDEAKKKKLCDRGLHQLMDLAWVIPTGPIHFTLLVRPQWKGWKLNELNQLDLSDLTFEETK